MKITLDRPLALQLLAALAGSALLAVAVGGLAGVGVFAVAMAASSPEDTWAQLGAFIFGILGGAVAGTGTYIVAVLTATFRMRPAGARARPAAALVLVPIVAFLGLGATGSVGGEGLPGLLVGLGAVAVLTGVSVALGRISGAVAGPHAHGAAAAAMLAGLALVGLGQVATAAEMRAERHAIIESIGGLALVDGATLVAPSPTWTLESVDVSSYDPSVSVTWATGGTGDARLTIGGAGGGCAACYPLATGRNGQPVETDGFRYRTWVGSTPYTLIVDDGAADASAVELLGRLEAVPADRFIEACGPGC